MKTQIVSGRFLHSDGTPYEGEVRFEPRNLWVQEDGITWATLAPSQELDRGQFEVVLNIGKYVVFTPIGRWKLHIKENERGFSYLSDHLPSRFQ